MDHTKQTSIDHLENQLIWEIQIKDQLKQTIPTNLKI